MAAPSTPPQAGVLLAAGRSRRMGTPKQLLPVPDTTGRGAVPMVVRAFDLLARICDERIVVVTGHDAANVIAALAGRKFTQATSDPDADMFHSVRLGFSRLLDAFPDADRVWLHLADHPFVRADTIGLLATHFETHTARTAILPLYAGRGGHPALIPRDLLPAIINWQGDGGLRSFWLQHPAHATRINVDDPGVVHDLDTPRDYDDAVRAPRRD